jgi:hypothetical protein
MMIVTDISIINPEISNMARWSDLVLRPVAREQNTASAANGSIAPLHRFYPNAAMAKTTTAME